MSLKSRLLKNRELKSVKFSKISADCDLLSFFREHKEFDVITAYSHDKIYGETNGSIVKIPLVFSSAENYLIEVEKIARLYDCFLDKKNPQATISTPSNSVINILIPPIVANEPFISILRKNKQQYSSYFATKIISSEMAAYLRDCISQRANIFIVGDASVDKTPLMNFIINLSENNKKNIICGKTEKIIVEKPCSIKLSKGCIKDIENLIYDNIFYSDAQISDLTQIFQLIISGHNGFVVSMSLKENVDILPAIRNMLLLSNINLFEENADFMTSSSIDVVICVNKTDGDFCVTKISEMVRNTQNDYSIKDIFVRNSKGYHISTGNSSRFFNVENSQRFMREFLEEGHKHSYIAGQATPINSNVPNKESKKKRLKEKLKRLKKEKFVIPVVDETVEDVKNNIQIEDISEKQIQKTESASLINEEKSLEESNSFLETSQEERSFEIDEEDSITFFGKKIKEVEEEIPLNNPQKKEKTKTLNIDESIFNINISSPSVSFQDVLESSANEGLLSNETDDFSQEMPRPNIKNILDLDDEDFPPKEIVDNEKELVDNDYEKADLSSLIGKDELASIEEELENKYNENNFEIVEEPQLFSEISENEVREYEKNLLDDIDDDI